mmetsp:Transcript_112511/g.199410  ORF Transcript_112511/g.199410 Transcript_112511/m.199410 type:complete len:512 (-) Transcript_112511:79-1614(-)
MRFGKKLALQVTDDQSGAPYLSHKLMKEAINKTVRELRLYQSKLNSGSEQVWQGAGGNQETEAATQEELSELESRVSALDQQLFMLVDEDLERILQHIRGSEVMLKQKIAGLQASAHNLGMLVEESQMQQIEKAMPVVAENRTVLCQQLLELWLRSQPAEAAKELEDLAAKYNNLVESVNRHSQYLEINVAGFRKLLKRHEKQIPQNFHARHTPFLGFHRLVTHTSRQMLEITKQFGSMLTDAWDRLCRIAPECRGSQPEMKDLKSLGAECQMVLEIQKQLKDPMHSNMLQLQSQGGSPGFLYPKPGAELTNSSLVPKVDISRLAEGLKNKAKSGSGAPQQANAGGAQRGQQQQQPQLAATASDHAAAMQAWWALQNAQKGQASGQSLASGAQAALMGHGGGFGMQPGANVGEELWRMINPNAAAAATAAAAAASSQVMQPVGNASTEQSEVERLRAELEAERLRSAAQRIELQRLQTSASTAMTLMPREVVNLNQVINGGSGPGIWHDSI